MKGGSTEGGSTNTDLSLVGYFPKRVSQAPEWLSVPTVVEICSVSLCISPGPKHWISAWRHNAAGLYDSPAVALEIAEGEEGPWQIHAYRLGGTLFTRSGPEPLEIGPLDCEPLPANYRSLGFDVVGWRAPGAFECSPLSCNRLAASWAVNRVCLLPTVETAQRAATEFALDEPEPGPYAVVEVLRPEHA